MTDAELLRAALNFLGWKPSDLTQLLQLEGSHDRSTTHRWLSGSTAVPPQLKVLMKHHVLKALPCSQKPAKTKVILVCGTDGGIGVSPFAVTLAHLLSEFGLKTDCYHAGRDPIDVRWSMGGVLSTKTPRGQDHKDEAYLTELNVLLANAGAGALDLDCLVIDVSRRLEGSDHYANAIAAADTAIVLTRDWSSSRLRMFDRIKATGTPVKALVKLHSLRLPQLRGLLEMPSDTDIKHLSATFFNSILIDSKLRADVNDCTHLQQELRTPSHTRTSPMMVACAEVSREVLSMLGLEFIDSLESSLGDIHGFTLEEIIKQVCVNLPGVTAAQA